MKAEVVSREQERVEAARREVTHRMERLRSSLAREVSWWPKGQKWVLPMVAFATGVAIARGKKSPPSPSVARDARR